MIAEVITRTSDAVSGAHRAELRALATLRGLAQGSATVAEVVQAAQEYERACVVLGAVRAEAVGFRRTTRR